MKIIITLKLFVWFFYLKNRDLIFYLQGVAWSSISPFRYIKIKVNTPDAQAVNKNRFRQALFFQYDDG